MGEQNEVISKLKEQIESLEKLRGVLGDDVIEAKLSELKLQLGQLIQTQGGAYVAGSVDTRGGDFIGRDKILANLAEGAVIIGGNAQGVIVVTGDGNTITVAADGLDPETLLQAYYRALANECSRLPLGVVDPQFAQPGKQAGLSIADVYTDLDVVSPPREEDETARAWGLKLARGEGGERTPLLEAISLPNAPRLVLLGDAPVNGFPVHPSSDRRCSRTGFPFR